LHFNFSAIAGEEEKQTEIKCDIHKTSCAKTLSDSGSMLAYFPLGLLLGLLPCGPVYTALISAARTGMEVSSPLEGFYMGAGLMMCFGLGTVPSLLLIARLADLKWLKSREIIYRVGSILMIIVGGYFVIKGIQF